MPTAANGGKRNGGFRNSAYTNRLFVQVIRSATNRHQYSHSDDFTHKAGLPIGRARPKLDALVAFRRSSVDLADHIVTTPPVPCAGLLPMKLGILAISADAVDVRQGAFKGIYVVRSFYIRVVFWCARECDTAGEEAILGVLGPRYRDHHRGKTLLIFDEHLTRSDNL
jgi:hypothetical protein